MTLTVNFVSNQQGIVAAATLTQVRFWDKSLTTNGVVTSWLWKFGDKYTWIPDGGVNPTWVDISGASTTIFQVNDRVWFSSTGSLPGSLVATTLYWVKSVFVAGGYTGITVSTTQGGAAVSVNGSYSGTLYIQHGSDQQNPIASYRSIAAGQYDVALTCNDSGGTGLTTTTKTGYINAVAYSFSKPVNAGIFGRISIFVYNSTVATVINRVKSNNNNLYFQSLKATGYMDKAGVATFIVYQNGSATATETGLMVADSSVAIIAGRDVIWSGKITKAVKTVINTFDTANPACYWTVECDSDIAKMKNQNVKSANQISYNAPPGYIINQLVAPNAAGDINWAGVVTPSIISYEGANIQYTITNADMYSQFITLAELTGYDWRTRNDWVKYAYGVSGYSPSAKTVTVSAIAPYTTNNFAGYWLLFVNANNADVVTLAFNNGGGNGNLQPIVVGDTLRQQGGTVHGIVQQVTVTSGSWAAGTAAGTIVLLETDGTWVGSQYCDDVTKSLSNEAYITGVTPVSQTNNTGIKSFGLIASNTTTVITLASITNPMNPPVSSDDVIILGTPVLDFSSDLRQPSYLSTFTINKARQSTLQNGYEFTDQSDFKQVATSVIVKSKIPYAPTVAAGAWPTLVNNGSATLPLYAKDAWGVQANFFQNSTWITQKTSGYIYSYTANATTLIVIGQGFAIKNGDKLMMVATRTPGGAQVTPSLTLNADPTTQTQADGTLTTTFSFASAPDTYSWAKYGSFLCLNRLYVKDTSIYTGADSTYYIDGIPEFVANGTGVDAVYGPYLSASYLTETVSIPFPFLPGAIVTNSAYSQASPQTGSPLQIFGNILKTMTLDTMVPFEYLGLYATNYLINNSYYYRKGGFWAFVYDWFKPDIRPVNEVSENGWLKAGDEICVLQNTADTPTDLQYGQYKNQWQILGWTLDADQMVVTAELGDFERNTNTLINDKTSGINYTIT